MLITHQAKLLERKELAHEVYLFRFSYPADAGWTFKPGQYMIFLIPQKDKEHPARRLYSIASTPAQNDSLDFVIEYVPNGLGTNLLSKLKIGEAVTMQGPAGIFVLKDSPRNKVFLATGTGIAPVRSIIESMLTLPQAESKKVDQENMLLQRLQHLGEQKRLYLYWGMKTCEDMYFLDEFKALAGKYDNFTFKYCFSREEDLVNHLKEDSKHAMLGRVNVGLEDLLTRYELKITDFDYYICGANPVVESLRQYLYDKNVPKEQVIFEKFV